MQTPASRTSASSRHLNLGGISRSTNSLNEIDLSENNERSAGSGHHHHHHHKNHLRPSRYSRGSKVRRNHSLSPLRFCQRESQEEKDSEAQQLLQLQAELGLDSDSASVLSNDDDGNSSSLADGLENLETDPANNEGTTTNNSTSGGDGTENTAEDKEVEHHLLAPSKVAKSQDLFTKALFPVEASKPLLSREELAKVRSATSGSGQVGSQLLQLKRKQQAHAQSLSLSQESSRGSESPDSAGGSLRVDYLSHLRDHSASPEASRRERELVAVANTRKFKTFMNYWENKTTELLDKKKNFEQWHQANSVVDLAPKAVPQTR